MDLTRTARVLAARWPVVVLLALLGAVAGWAGAEVRNNSIEPVFEAAAPISLVEGVVDEEGQGNRAASDTVTRLTSIQSAALEANRDEIDLDPSTSDFETSPQRGNVTVDEDTNEVLFVAAAPTEEAAAARADELRRNYLADPSAGARDDYTDRRETLAGQLEEVRASIAALEIEVAGLDPEAERRLELISLQEALRSRLLGFREELLIPDILAREQVQTGETDTAPEPRSAQEIQADIDEISLQLTSVGTELASIAPPANPEFSAAQTELEVYQQRYTDLEAEYLTYSLLLAELENLVAPGQLDTRDLTPADTSPALYALVGLMLGTSLAAAGILSGDRLRAPVWVGSDAHFLPALATMAERKPTSKAWYDQAGESRRRTEVQALRAGVLARLHGRAGSVAIAGSRIDSVAVRALAADLSVALAQSGRSVVLVDADFKPSAGLAEFPDGGLTLANMVVDLRAGVAPEMAAVSQVRPNLWSLPSGSFDEDPADLFAGDVLDRALEALANRFDMVIVSAGDVANTVAQEVVTRSNTSLFVASAGKTLANELRLYAEEFNRRGANLLGMVIITRQTLPKLADTWARLTSKGTAVIAPTEETGRSDVSEPAVVVAVPAEAEVAMMERIGSNGEAGDKLVGSLGVRGTSAQPEPRRLYDVLRRPTEDTVGEGAMAEILASTLSSIDPARAYGPMADFMADMAEEIILRPRTVGFDHDGMLPLHPVKDRTTVGSAIGRLLRDDLGSKEGAALERQIIEILFGSGPLRSVPVVRKSLDAWLSIAFFRVHLARSRDPQILHLVSPNRYFQIMVDAQRFDSDHVATLTDEVLPMFIQDVERQQRAASRFGSEEAIAQLDRAIEDARTLGASLGDLQMGRVAEARLYYPWTDDHVPAGWTPRWDEDVRATLVPLQRLGLLAVPVLTPEELEYMVPTA